jgi:hypothetical protein
LNAGQVTRLLKRLPIHGINKRVNMHCRNYLADLGRSVANSVMYGCSPFYKKSGLTLTGRLL